MNKEEILKATTLWDDFVNNLSAQEKENLLPYTDPINSLNIYRHYVNKDYIKFDQVINILPKQYQFEDNIIEMVYSCYVERNLPEVALTYLDNAIAYHQQEELPTSLDFTELRTKLLDQKLFDNLRRSLAHLRNLDPEHIPGILPSILNGQYQFKEFILGEIVAALKVLAKKKMAIRVEKENYINDILVAILRLRFPLWGWEIADQERSGKSSSGKDAGELDCTIKAAGNDLALIEAFILKGKETGKITDHINKCFGYIENITAHYIVVYYRGKKDNFDTTWESYTEVVVNMHFPTKHNLDKTIGITSVNFLFKEVQNMKIAKTKHNSIYVYHIMLDLS